MIHEAHPVSFHNVVQLVPTVGNSGLQLRRFPEGVCNAQELSMNGRLWMSRMTTGCEIRFVSDAPCIAVYLSSTGTRSSYLVFRGDYRHGPEETMEMGRIYRKELMHQPLDPMTAEGNQTRRFAPNLWRIYCQSAPLAFHGIESFGYDIRPPRPDEIPGTRWLAYGSSITMSGNSYESYVNTAAEILGMDVLNLGMAGSCLLEPTFAGHIAARDDWDFSTLELGINALEIEMADDEFEKRARYLILKIVESQPEKPVVLLTLFRNRGDYVVTPASPGMFDNERFRRILRGIACELNHPNLHIIEGTELFQDLTGFCSDLLHPGPIAHIRAGIELASRLKQIV